MVTYQEYHECDESAADVPHVVLEQLLDLIEAALVPDVLLVMGGHGHVAQALVHGRVLRLTAAPGHAVLVCLRPDRPRLQVVGRVVPAAALQLNKSTNLVTIPL